MEEKENHYKFPGDGKGSNKMKNNELNRSEDGDVQSWELEAVVPS